MRPPARTDALNINLTNSPKLRIVTLCALYFAQGMPFGFVTVTLVAYLSHHGLGVGAVGQLTALSTLPWSFKWIWGPLIDRYGSRSMGRRRPWILLAQSLMAVTIAAMIAIPDLTTDFVMLSWFVFLHNVFGSMQDVAVDALAVDLLEEQERGKANGLMYGASYFGTAVGGAGLGLVLAVAGIRTAMLVQVSILLGIMLFPLLLRERAGERLLPWTRGRTMTNVETRAPQSLWDLLRDLGRAFALRSTLLGGLLALTVKVGLGVSVAVTAVYFIQRLHWTQTEYTNVVGGGAVLLGLATSVAGGFIADRFGARRVAVLASLALGLLWVTFALLHPAWDRRWLGIAFLYAQEMLAALLTVSLFSLFMGIAWPVVAATQFTAYMALMNLSNTFGAWSAGLLSEHLSVPAVFLLLGLFQAALIGILWGIDPHETRRKLETSLGEM